MDVIDPILLVLGGVLAASSLIVAKRPDAKATIDKLVPYQAIIGVALLVFGVVDVVRWRGFLVDAFDYSALHGAMLWASIICSFLLGVLFGMPVVAKMSPEGAAKGEQVAKKLAPYQLMIGLVAIVAGVLGLLYWLRILK